MTAPSSQYLISRVMDNVNDPAFSREGDILPALNKCLRILSRTIKFPDLFSGLTDVTCDAGEVSTDMPDDFGHHIVHAKNTTNSVLNGRVKIWRSFAQFSARFFDFDHYPPVAHVCPVGKKLWFQGKPTSDETLQILYTKAPTLYTIDGRENTLTTDPAKIAIIDWIPEDFQEDLLVNYASAEMWKRREQGFQGSRANYNKYITDFDEAKEALLDHLGPLQVDEGPDFAVMTNYESGGDPVDELY